MGNKEVAAPSILLFVVNYNSWKDLDAMLGSFSGLANKPDIWIYHNASGADEFPMLREKHPSAPFSVFIATSIHGHSGALREYFYSHPLMHDAVVQSNADVLFTDCEVFTSFERILCDADVGIIGPGITDARTGTQLNPHSSSAVGISLHC